MVAPDSPADSATGVFVPESVDGAKLIKNLRDNFGVNLAGRKDQLMEGKGRAHCPLGLCRHL
jgi:hypothetical protein